MPDTSFRADADILTVHAAIARALHELEVDALFGLVGDSNLFMVDSFVRAHQGRHVASCHEAAAVMMALGHAAMTGGVGVATITQGPALSNAITPLIDGVKGMLPMVLLCGDTSSADPEHPQCVAQQALVAATGAGYARMRSPALAVQDVAQAFYRARAERRPFVLAMPTEFIWEIAPYPGLPTAPQLAAAKPDPESAAIEEAVGMLAAARSPVVLAGRGAIPAREALIRLARRIGAPLATTLKAKGLFQGEPYDLGVFGTLSTLAASEAIAKADVIVSFGAGLNRFTTAKGGWVQDKRVIEVNDDARQLTRLVASDLAIEGGAAEVADLLTHWFDAAEIPSSQSTDTLDPKALAARIPRPKPRSKDGTVDLSLALDRLDAALHPDRIFTSDGGRFLNEAWTRISVVHPRNMLLSTNTGAIGLGMGYAIGAAVARPKQQVVLVTGDGGFMMGGVAELATAAREALNLVVVICNDNCYGAEYVQFEDRQMDPGMSLFEWPALSGAAAGLGVKGVRVRSEAELDAAIDTLQSHQGPLVIELMLDPAAVPRLHL
jgi:thiamine pyrophosphate-dependent acetolactate synthase large subunit-like protein